MTQQKRYIDRLRAQLQELGLYQAKNEELIRCAARCQWFIDMMEEELRRKGLTLQTMKYGGAITQEIQHPHVESIRKYNAVLARCLIALGMGNKDVEPDADTDAMIAFMNL